MKAQKDEDVVKAHITYCGIMNVGKIRSFKRSTLTYSQFYNKINERYGGQVKLLLTFVTDDKSEITFDDPVSQKGTFQLLVKQSKQLKCNVRVINLTPQAAQNLARQVKEGRGSNSVSLNSKFQQKASEVAQNKQRDIKSTLTNQSPKISSSRQKPIEIQKRPTDKNKDKQTRQKKVEAAQPSKKPSTMAKKKEKAIQANTVKQQIPKQAPKPLEGISPNQAIVESVIYDAQENNQVVKVWTGDSINKSIQNQTKPRNTNTNPQLVHTPSTTSNPSNTLANFINQDPYQSNNRNSSTTIGSTDPLTKHRPHEQKPIQKIKTQESSALQTSTIDHQLQQLKRQLQTSAKYLKEIMVALGLTCLQCKAQNFSGPYYQCLICKDKYLCSSCEQQTSLKNHPQRSHPFAKLKREGESVSNIQIKTTSIHDIRLVFEHSLENQDAGIISTDSYLHSRI